MSYYDLLLTLLIRTARDASRSLEKELGRVGSSSAHVPVYFALAGNQAMTQTELAIEAGVEQPTMALTLARMERDGIVSRKPNPRDGRSLLYLLTASARAQIADVESALTVVERRVADHLKTHDLVALRSALRLIGAGLADEPHDTADASKKATRHKTSEQAITSTPASAGLAGSVATIFPIALPEATVFREPRTKYEFPIGFEITARWKKTTFTARVSEGGWVLDESGETYESVFDLSMAAFGDARDAWLTWKYRNDHGRLVPLDMYRLEKR